MKNVFDESISYSLIKSNSKPIAGNPKIIATKGNKAILQRGKEEPYYYGVIIIGKSITSVKEWQRKPYITSLLEDKGFKKVTPIDYEES